MLIVYSGMSNVKYHPLKPYVSCLTIGNYFGNNSQVNFYMVILIFPANYLLIDQGGSSH